MGSACSVYFFGLEYLFLLPNPSALRTTIQLSVHRSTVSFSMKPFWFLLTSLSLNLAWFTFEDGFPRDLSALDKLLPSRDPGFFIPVSQAARTDLAHNKHSGNVC